MPEGPEVASMSDDLSLVATDQILTKIETRSNPNSKKLKHQLQNLQELLPLKVKQITSHGKRILFFFHNTDLILTSFLCMSGGWYVNNTNSKHWYVKLYFGEQLLLSFCDTRSWGDNILIKQKDLTSYKKLHGQVCLLRERQFLSQKRWLEIFRTRPKMQICQALMEQKLVGGIGNYLKAEILYTAKIRPDRLVKDITDAEMNLIRLASLNISRASYLAKGCTLKDFLTSTGEKTSFKCIVYGCPEDPLGNPVIVQEFKDKRKTHWVPNVQI